MDLQWVHAIHYKTMTLRNQMNSETLYYESQWYPPSVHNNNFYQINSETLKLPNFHYLLTGPRIIILT